MASRFWRQGLASVALGALLALTPAAVPQAQTAQVAQIKGAEQANHGRLVITLPAAQKVTARVSNGVLVVNFAQAVNISVDRIVREMPGYLTVARADPDGLGLRFALTRPYTANVMEAGERIFIDLIPENWQGMLPGLPQEVVEDLARRARTAEATARELQRAREQAEPREIEVRGSTLPTLSRLIFEMPSFLPADHKVANGRVDVSIAAPVRLEPSRVRSVLPEGVKLEEVEAANGLLRFALSAEPRYTIKAFREDDGLIIDLVRTDRNTASPEVQPELPAAPQPAQARPAQARPQPAAPPARQTAASAPAQPAAQAAAAQGTSAQGTSAQATPAQAPSAPAAATAQALPPQPVTVRAEQGEQGARIDFVFPRRTAAAAFEDGDEMVLVFETIDQIDPVAMQRALPMAEQVQVTRENKATLVRLRLRDGVLPRFAPDGLTWSLTTGERGVAPAEPISPRRAVDEGGQTIITATIPNISGVHWIGSDTPQPLAVVTAFGPAAALVKPHRFVEFKLDQTAHGLMVRPVADDIAVRATIDGVTIGRGGGLAVSVLQADSGNPAEAARPALVADRAAWNEMRLGTTRTRMQALQRAAVEAARSERSNARLRLATFFLANGLHAEALGPIHTLLVDDPGMRTDRRPYLTRAIAQVMMRRHRDADQTLGLELLKDDLEASLWRAVSDARQGRFPRALAGFRRVGEIVDAYPEPLQAIIRPEIARAAIAMRDQGVADRELTLLAELAPQWLPRDAVTLLRAELDEVTGRPESALQAYRGLFDSLSRPIAARAQLKGVQLAEREDDRSLSPEEKLARLETVSMTWRGDDIEIEAIGALGAIYADQKRWREAFAVARRATGFFPDHPITRRLHEETARQFEELFTSGASEGLSRVDALALFYDFKEFLPIGRRGDEITRRLADRLVEVDLLDQAAELLQHQIDNRLTGAARATVAARLAMIRLMNNRPADALRALTATRLPELPRDVKRARQLLEAKALSDLSRTDLALEILAAEQGPEVDRLRADILWSARRWREAGEAHERILGESWRGSEPLSERERADALRAGVAYVMANEALSLDRLRAKFAARMAETPDARVFAFVTGANRSRAGDIRELARSVANSDTLMEFMAEYRKRYPDYASSLRRRAPANQPQPAPGQPPAAQTSGQEPPAAAGERQAENQPAERRG